MSTGLTNEETPLAWPSSASTDDLMACNTCGVRVYSPNPGTLQILTRRQADGVGDGVNIEEDSGIGADYRGQRYSFQEAIFHVPGLHVFPGQSAVYPAEYHVHMTTYSKPSRSITIVIPVSHLVTGVGQDYYAAMAAQPDPSVTRPTLSTILVPGTPILQYQGPDIRGRTKDVPVSSLNDTSEWQFLLVLTPTQIRATDLERIPREGSLSTDPRDLPATGIAPTTQIPHNRLLLRTVMANPGILGPPDSTDPVSSTPQGMEVECKPLQVLDGKTIVEIDRVAAPVNVGYRGLGAGDPTSTPDDYSSIYSGIFTIGLFIGIITADSFMRYFAWGTLFEGTRVRASEPLKLVFIALVLVLAGFNYDVSTIPNIVSSIQSLMS